MRRLAHKITMITGAASGIGAATAELFANEGAVVAAVDVQDFSSPANENITTYRLDVSDEKDWSNVVSDIIGQHGRIDVLINNAGIGGLGQPVTEVSLEDWNRVIAVTQTGVLLGMREVIPHMQRTGGGAIVNISSIWGNTAVAGLAAYHAAKGAVRTLTKNAAVTYARDGVRVNSVHPGFVDTPMTRGVAPDANARVIGATPLGRGANPSELAYAVLFLASDEASFITGAELAVDGGYLAA